VAIVGSGVAGLAAGVLLAKRGFAVRVYEASGKPGGCCANTRIDGYTFHDGAIQLGLPRLLDAGFERLGLDRERLVPLRPIDGGYRATFEDGRVVSVARGSVRLERPHERHAACANDEVARFLTRWKPLASLLTEDLLLRPPSPGRALWRGGADLLKLRGTVGAELRRSFSDEAVQAALAGFLLYAGVAPDDLPAASIIGLVALLDEGFFLPAGGMGRIAEALAEALASHGGEVHLHSEVERVLVADGRARGIQAAGHDRVEADLVVSAVTGMATFGSLIAPEHVPASMRRKVDRSPLSNTAISVQLGLRNRLDSPGICAVLPVMSDQHRVISGTESDRWLNWSVPTATVPELAPPGGSIVEMFSPVRRGVETARDLVDQQADRMIAALARVHPLDIAVRRVRDPRQFREDMHLFEGSLYGLSPAAGLRAQFTHRTPIRGLFQTGQTTYPGYGVNTAIVSGVLAAEDIIGEQRRRLY
jgi:phytoene desaturase